MDNFRIYCENDRKYYEVPFGTPLNELVQEPDTLAVLVDNQLKELNFRVMNAHTIRFVNYDHPDGRRTYIRSLCFVLQKVVRELFPEKVLVIDYSLPSGLYCENRER